MSKFYKLFIFLLIILLLEIIFIYRGLSIKNNTNNGIGVSAYVSKKPVVILVDVPSNRLDLYQNGNLLKTYTVACGKLSTPSPIGVWKVVNKDVWGEGFGGHWLGLNVPWGKYGIHGTIFPNSIGWNSSHGCIRMKNDDVSELYKLTPYGTTVVIWGGEFEQFGYGLRTIKPGDRGRDVLEIQKVLKEKGYYKGTPDGIYGEWMKAVVQKYQKDNKLAISNYINYTFYQKLGIYIID